MFMILQLLYQEANPGVQYEYSIPKGISQQTDPDSYSWISSEFSVCSATCGGGKNAIDYRCSKIKNVNL